MPIFEQQNYIKITQNLGMSNNNQQPSTTAKVILYTSHGQLDLQLWTKEAPLASRNFIQLCLQGYYTNTIFHRIIPGFMVQGGDPTGTGTGGQSVWGKPFKDQFHQRLKFSRRGLLAMANSGKNTNRSQFFITFGQCQHLNKKHTIFGKVIGDTIYNLLQMQSIDTDPATDRPIDPPVIRKVKVAVNPFDDIQPRVTVKQQKQNKLTKQQESRVIDNEKQAKKKQMKKLKQRNKLTFDDQELQPLQNDKMISAHDVLQDQKLCKKQAITYEQINKRRLQKQSQQNKKQALKSKIMQSQQVNHQHNQNEGFLQQQKQKKRKMLSNIQVNSNTQDEVLHYKKRVNPQTGKVQIYWVKQEQIEQQQNQQSPEIEDQKLREVRQLQIKEYQALKAEQLNFKRTKQGSLKQKRKQMIGEEKALLSNVQRRRYQYLKKTETEKRQGQIFEKLGKFTNTLLHGGSWMNHGLKFHIDSENAYKISSQRNNNRQLEDDGGLEMADDYVNAGKRDGIDIDELYELTKKDK